MKIGFIGAGNMGCAIMRGAFQGGFLKPYETMVYDVSEQQLAALTAAYPVNVAENNIQIARECEFIILAIKPIYMRGVLEEIQKYCYNKKIISIAAGWSRARLTEILGRENGAQVLRVMPNTPLAVGEGMSLISSLCTCTDEEFDFAKSVFAAAGKVAVVEDHVYTPANGISGCGPAFVYAFIEAMADGGVRYGVPRALAYELAAQTLVGAARMVLETGEHPGKLKDAVCSPGGTTIEGMYALEKGGMRAAVMDAVGATVEKTMRMSKK